MIALTHIIKVRAKNFLKTNVRKILPSYDIINIIMKQRTEVFA